MDTGLSMLHDPSSNLVPLGDEIPSDTGIQETLRAVHEEAGNAAVRARLGLGVARAEAELRDLPQPTAARLRAIFEAAAFGGDVGQETPDAAGSDTSASTTTTDSASSMDTSSDSTITESGQNARVEPLPVEPPSAPARRDPFNLNYPSPPAIPRLEFVHIARSPSDPPPRDEAAPVAGRRRPTAAREGNVSFLRGQDNIPVICINIEENVWRWIPFHELAAPDFIKYRDQISSYISRVQSRARSNYVRARVQQRANTTLYLPAPDERAFLLTLFNNHLEDHEKRRYITEFSHTIIGESHCSGCLNVNYQDKVKCIHYDCPGMCEDCAKQIEDTCPICEKAQIITCPICKDEKKKGEIGFAPSGCGHAVCWACMGKAYQVNAQGLRKCPQCREPWHKSH